MTDAPATPPADAPKGRRATALKGQARVELDGDLAVIMLGMRVNRPWKLGRWLPVFRAMTAMLKELEADPALGLIAVERYARWPNFVTVQYWKSLDHIHAYARSTAHSHAKWWGEYNRTLLGSGDVGVWHEAYAVKREHAEGLYRDMPPQGLALAGRLLPGRRAE